MLLLRFMNLNGSINQILTPSCNPVLFQEINEIKFGVISDVMRPYLASKSFGRGYTSLCVCRCVFIRDKLWRHCGPVLIKMPISKPKSVSTGKQ